ncbi:HlyC/CorC family transporter [Desertihabitans brevis]|uniref:HlyC/CorC family transporter n=1 Tax=Desertihabitans brevis TaxID=2268447 RepID=A0A367YVN8_9ACTN|nr:hemolysin family protein [Desertihabitans brevis]RCK69878.1 HlyC/CorC family transporter [Desertihabitans brevis]
MDVLLNSLMVLLFVLIGGVFAATEMALVSLREGQIRRLERTSKAGRKVAALAKDSGTFLSAVQIGVTFAGFFSSAFGASTIAPSIAPLFVSLGLPEGVATTVALVVMTALVSYLSLVLGELVPKRIALSRNAAVATVVGPPLSRFAVLMKPLIWIVDASSAAILRLIGVNPDDDGSAMSDEEVRDLVTSHEGFDRAERDMVEDVFQASDTLLREVMRHRRDVVALRDDMTLAEAVAFVRQQPHSRYPVFHETIDDVVGFVHIRDLYEAAATAGPEAGIAEVVRPVLELPGTATLVPALNHMRSSGQHLAMVIDEYGGTDGLATLEDLLEELVGEIWDERDSAEHREEMQLHDSRTFDGRTTLEDFADRTGVTLAEGPYETVAGWMLWRLGRLAATGDVVPIAADDTADRADDESADIRYQLEVVTVEGSRITTVELQKTTVDA